jgi:hypothetical protein
MKERRGLSSIGSRRSGDLVRSKRPILQRGEEVQFHTREHGEGGIDRVCQVFDCLRVGPWLGAHVGTSQLSSKTVT